MKFAGSKTNEYLIVGKNGEVRNLGIATRAFLSSRSTFVLIPAAQQVASFQLTQETMDGIPLRFKGEAIYRISNPEAAAKRFNFAEGSGIKEINTSISNVCFGELRDLISHMSMQECIEQRKTRLSEAISSNLKRVVSSTEPEKGWGIELEIAQVSQVFIVDDDIRKQLDAEIRNQLKSTSELSDISTDEDIQQARSLSATRLGKEKMIAEKERLEIEMEIFRLQKAMKLKEIETQTPVQLLEIEKKREILQKKLKLQQLENQVYEHELKREMMKENARISQQKELLPLTQMPEIANALSQIFQGANLSFYGENIPFLTGLTPVMEKITQAFAAVNPGNSGKQELR